MKKILLVLAVFAAFSIASQSATAGGWWNESWHFRVPVNVSFSAPAQNASVNASVNFAAALSALGISGMFDKNSLRVVENNSDLPADFFNTTLTAGNVSWIANGTTAAGANRTFYIYFDIAENGAKAAGKLISESCNNYGNSTCYWRSNYTNSMDVWSNQIASPGVGYEWNRSWAQSIEVAWKWNTETAFDKSYLYINGVFYSQKDGINSEILQVSGSKLSARFESDSSNIVSATDSYGTYGTAVDTIKFYPTANITTGAFTASQSAAQKQYPPNLSGVSVSGAGWGGTFNYTLNASDSERDNVSVTLFTYQNGRWNRNATLVGNNTILNWTISPFSCSDLGALNYMFEYNDSSHAPVNSSNYSQTLEKDDIALEYYSGNASVNREGSGNITFGIKLNDTDRRAYVSGESVNFWAYYSGAWNSAGANTTITGGAGIYSFGPNCSQSAGGNIWKANYSGTCYKPGESANIIYTAVGQIKNYLIQPPPLSYDLGLPVPIEANITDECANPISGAGVNFSVNATNYTAVDWGGGKYNYSWDSLGKATGNYTIQINASKLFYLFNLTSWFNAFTVAAGPPQINISLNASQAAQNSIVEINASIADMGGSGINWVRANITYPNSTTAQYNMTNLSSSVWQTVLNDTLQRGQYNITVYASDNFGNAGNSANITRIYARLNVSLNTKPAFYLGKEWQGSVYYRMHDESGYGLQNVAVNLSITRPDNDTLYFLSGKNYVSDANGFLGTPIFMLPSNIPLGNYNLTAISSYNDTTVDILVNNTATFAFVVFPSAELAGFVAKVVTQDVSYISHEMSIGALFQNDTGLIDPENFSASVYYQSSQFNLTPWYSISKSDMYKSSSGIYTYSISVPTSTTTGNYIILSNATSNGVTVNSIVPFMVLKEGGAFDISVMAQKTQQGSNAVATVSLFNKMSDSIEVKQYNIDIDTCEFSQGQACFTCYAKDSLGARISGTSLASPGSFLILTQQSLTNTTTIKTSALSSGEYWYYCEIKYDANKTASPSSSPFSIIAYTLPSVTPSTGAGGVGAGAAPAVIPNISANVSLWITGYPAEIEIERGWAKFVTVTVNSSGVLHNVSVKFLDIPDEWFEVQTQPAQTLDGSKQFLVRFSIPSEIKSGNYKARLRAASAESSDEKEVIIRVFGSKEELIKYQLETVKEKILYLDALLNQTEREGKDVRKLRDALDGIKLQAENAESLLDRKLYDGASSTIITIKELLNTLEADIDALRKEKAESSLASWALFGLIGLGILLVIFFIYLSRKIKGSEKLALQKFSEIKRLILGKTAGAGLRGDMEKTRKMIKLIQKEYNEGMITKETYEELKRINGEKLLQSGKKMSDLGIKE